MQPNLMTALVQLFPAAPTTEVPGMHMEQDEARTVKTWEWPLHQPVSIEVPQFLPEDIRMLIHDSTVIVKLKGHTKKGVFIAMV